MVRIGGQHALGRELARACGPARTSVATRASETPIDLRDERHGPRGSRVRLDHPDPLVLHGELQVQQADHAEPAREPARDVLDHVELVVGRGWPAGSGTTSRPECTPASSMCSITPPTNTSPPSHTASTSTSIAPSRNRSISTGWSGEASAAVRDEALELLVVVDDLHRAAAEHVGGPHDDRVPDLRRDRAGLLHRARLAVRRRGDLELVQDLGELPAVLGQVDRVRRGAEDREALVLEDPCELQRRLSAELGDHADRPLGVADRQHVLGRERLEVQPARGVVVGRDGLGVRVHHHRLEPGLLERERRVHARVVELDALADPVRAGAEDHDARPFGGQDLGLPPRRSSSGTACAPGTRPPHVSTVLNTGATPSASRWRRTAASVAPVSSAEAARRTSPGVSRRGSSRRRASCSGRPRSAVALLDDLGDLVDEPRVDARGRRDLARP